MRHGTRVMILDHPDWQGTRLWGYEAVVTWVSNWGRVVVKLVWWKKEIHLNRHVVCPVYNDCEVCGYGAWGAVNAGTEKSPEYHHYCAWHLTRAREARGA